MFFARPPARGVLDGLAFAVPSRRCDVVPFSLLSWKNYRPNFPEFFHQLVGEHRNRDDVLLGALAVPLWLSVHSREFIDRVHDELFDSWYGNHRVCSRLSRIISCIRSMTCTFAPAVGQSRHVPESLGCRERAHPEFVLSSTPHSAALVFLNDHLLLHKEFHDIFHSTGTTTTCLLHDVHLWDFITVHLLQCGVSRTTLELTERLKLPPTVLPSAAQGHRSFRPRTRTSRRTLWQWLLPSVSVFGHEKSATCVVDRGQHDELSSNFFEKVSTACLHHNHFKRCHEGQTGIFWSTFVHIRDLGVLFTFLLLRGTPHEHSGDGTARLCHSGLMFDTTWRIDVLNSRDIKQKRTISAQPNYTSNLLRTCAVHVSVALSRTLTVCICSWRLAAF